MSTGNLHLLRGNQSDSRLNGDADLKKRILFVGEHDRVAQLLTRCLQGAGYRVNTATGFDVGGVLEGRFDLIVLNLSTSQSGHVSLCHTLRSRFEIPILALADDDDKTTESRILDAGADDFQRVDLPPRLFLARINALIRRGEKQPDRHKAARKVTIQDLVICHASQTVTRNGEAIELSAANFELLGLLATLPDHTWFREQLFNQLRGIEFDGQNRSADMRISNLRRALGDGQKPHRYIVTIRSKGYRLISSQRAL
jgi:two-component system response regulator RstA